MQVKCDQCEHLTANPLVYWQEDYPYILCQKCFAKKKVLPKYEKQPRTKLQLKKPSVKIKGDRYATLYSIKRTNMIVYIVQCYEKDELYDTWCYRAYQEAQKRQKAWLNHAPSILVRRQCKPCHDTPKTKGKRNKIRYVRAYNDNHYKQINLKLSLVKDKDLIAQFHLSKSKSEFVREMFELWKENQCKN